MGIIYNLHSFPNTRAKDEKTPLSKGPKTFAQEQFMETFSGALEGVLIPKTKNFAVRTFVPQILYYDQTILRMRKS